MHQEILQIKKKILFTIFFSGQRNRINSYRKISPDKQDINS